MKSIGMVRRVDNLGRIVIPKEIRDAYNIDRDTPLEIYVDGEYILLKKYSKGCKYCNTTKDVKEYKGDNICESCADDLYSVFVK